MILKFRRESHIVDINLGVITVRTVSGELSQPHAFQNEEEE